MSGTGAAVRPTQRSRGRALADLAGLRPLTGPALFFAVLGVLWLLLELAWLAFPYVRPGGDLVYATKQQWIRDLTLFGPADQQRLIVFGNSKVMTGFIPRLFDQSVDHAETTRGVSYNFGLPDSTRFVDALELLAARGQAPSTVLLTFPWEASAPSDSTTVFRFLDHDAAIMDTLFPFRTLPRDLVLFALLAPSHGGSAAYYGEGRAAVEQMTADRGYYFIEGQSHYAGNRLPDGFHLDTDQPTTVYRRDIPTSGTPFSQLRELAARYHINFYFVPLYFRAGEFAPPPDQDNPDAAEVETLRVYPEFQVLGPPYYVLPNAYFSDPEHLNPEGARVYTGQLTTLYEKARH